MVTFCANIYVRYFIEAELYLIQKKTKKSLFEQLFGGLTGNIRTPPIARGKPVVDLLFVIRNWTFFAISYGWDIISENQLKLVCFEGCMSLLVQIWFWRGRHPPSTVGVKKLQWSSFCVVSKLFGFVTKHVCDRQTELRQLILRQHSCSRGKNYGINGMKNMKQSCPQLYALKLTIKQNICL